MLEILKMFFMLCGDVLNYSRFGLWSLAGWTEQELFHEVVEADPKKALGSSFIYGNNLVCMVLS